MNRLAAALVLFLVALMGAPTVALAHSDIVSTVPEDGATLAEAPAELVFTFSEPLLPDFVRFIAMGADGTTEDLIVTGVDGAVATVSWPGGAAPGTWEVQYRVVSQDGHPVNGGITFTYDGGATPTATETSSAPEPSTPTPSSTAATSSQPSMSEASTTPTAAESSNSGWIIAGIAVVILAIVAVVGVVLRNRSS